MATTPATLVSNIAARFLRVGEVVTVGGFMRATITDVNAAWGDGYVRVVAVDSADQEWVVLYTKDQMVPLVHKDCKAQPDLLVPQEKPVL